MSYLRPQSVQAFRSILAGSNSAHLPTLGGATRLVRLYFFQFPSPNLLGSRVVTIPISWTLIGTHPCFNYTFTLRTNYCAHDLIIHLILTFQLSGLVGNRYLLPLYLIHISLSKLIQGWPKPFGPLICSLRGSVHHPQGSEFISLSHLSNAEIANRTAGFTIFRRRLLAGNFRNVLLLHKHGYTECTYA